MGFSIREDDNGNLVLERRRDGRVVAIYYVSEDCTRMHDGALVGRGNLLHAIVGGGPDYVYILIDPRQTPVAPFYVGKGRRGRALQHVGQARAEMVDEVVGMSGQEIVDREIADVASKKTEIIKSLLTDGYTPDRFVRVVARRVSEDVAFALESLMIRHVYSRSSLANVQPGHGEERFRAFGEWDYEDGFDIPANNSGMFTRDPGNSLGGFYVYVLRDPESGRIFYVGKGVGARISDHFNKALNFGARADEVERLGVIRDLLNRGYRPRDIGRVVARVESEPLALMVESFYIKFVAGLAGLANEVQGHHFYKFRSRGDLELRQGFDLPILIARGAPRDGLLDEFLGEGLDQDLFLVVRQFASLYRDLRLDFGEPRLHGAGELIMSALIPDVAPLPGEIVGKLRQDRVRGFARLEGPQNPALRVRVQVRFSRRFQVMVHGDRAEVAKAWLMWQMREKLGVDEPNRRDHQYRPDPWHVPLGSVGATLDPVEAARRIFQLVRIMQARSLRDLNLEEIGLLVAEPAVRRRNP